jgi:hypothetical protein
MALSASRSREDAVAATSPVAIPMLAETVTRCPPRSTGPASAARTRSAIPVASSTPGDRSTRIANSSPPRRARVSSARTADCSSRPTSRMSWSPAAWPRLSLTALKPSRSRKTTATSPPLRAVRRSASSSRSVNSARLASPVRTSEKASVARSASVRRTRRAANAAATAAAAPLSTRCSSTCSESPTGTRATARCAPASAAARTPESTAIRRRPAGGRAGASSTAGPPSGSAPVLGERVPVGRRRPADAS